MKHNQVLELARLAQSIPGAAASAWTIPACASESRNSAEAAALKYTGYRQITRQLKGRPPGRKAP